MTESGVWGTDIEIVAISCILDSYVYIVTEQYDAKKLWTRTVASCLENFWGGTDSGGSRNLWWGGISTQLGVWGAL